MDLIFESNKIILKIIEVQNFEIWKSNKKYIHILSVYIFKSICGIIYLNVNTLMDLIFELNKTRSKIRKVKNL